MEGMKFLLLVATCFYSMVNLSQSSPVDVICGKTNSFMYLRVAALKIKELAEVRMDDSNTRDVLPKILILIIPLETRASSVL